ncbi:MAG: serine hydrolase, partial [Gammaproteobacteria bacterium]
MKEGAACAGVSFRGHRWRRGLVPALLLALLAATATATAHAETELPGPDAGLAAFLDGLVTAAMQDEHLPGVVVSVTRPEGLVLERGWGVADLEAGTPMDPRRSLVRIASISKTMTFTGLMQLVEQGHVDLDEDLREALPEVRIEDRFGPLKPWHLMSHTPGYEDTYLGHFFARDISQDYEPADYLARFAPRRVRPPGEMTSYSHSGVALAGHLVAARSGEVLEDYMERRVFATLGMADTTFREHFENGAAYHMPAELAQRRARPYQWRRGAFEPLDPYQEHRGMAPAGSAWSTAADMARWMRAHLDGGANASGRVLREDTARAMHEVAFRNHPGMAGNAHGFWANLSHGYRTLEHGGALPGFHSNMVLVPELGLGVFVATNGEAGRPFARNLPDRVIGRLFPPRVPIPRDPPAEFDRSAAAYLGDYLVNRRGFTTMDKLAALGNATVRVTTDGEGHLFTAAGGETERWIALGNDLFASTENGRRIGFRMGPDGHATHLFGAYGATSAERVAYHRTDRFFIATTTLGAAAALLVLTGAVLRRLRRVPPDPRGALAGRLAVAAAGSWLLFLAGFTIHFTAIGGPVPAVLFTFPDWQTVALNIVAAVALLLTLAMLLALPRAWRAHGWSAWRRVRHSLALF